MTFLLGIGKFFLKRWILSSTITFLAPPLIAQYKLVKEIINYTNPPWTWEVFKENFPGLIQQYFFSCVLGIHAAIHNTWGLWVSKLFGIKHVSINVDSLVAASQRRTENIFRNPRDNLWPTLFESVARHLMSVRLSFYRRLGEWETRENAFHTADIYLTRKESELTIKEAALDHREKELDERHSTLLEDEKSLKIQSELLESTLAGIDYSESEIKEFREQHRELVELGKEREYLSATNSKLESEVKRVEALLFETQAELGASQAEVSLHKSILHSLFTKYIRPILEHLRNEGGECSISIPFPETRVEIKQIVELILKDDKVVRNLCTEVFDVPQDILNLVLEIQVKTEVDPALSTKPYLSAGETFESSVEGEISKEGE